MLCNTVVKNEILWEKHIKSEEHITGLKLLKEKRKISAKAEPKPTVQAEVIKAEQSISNIKEHSGDILENSISIQQQLTEEPTEVQAEQNKKNLVKMMIESSSRENQLPRVNYLVMIGIL